MVVLKIITTTQPDIAARNIMCLLRIQLFQPKIFEKRKCLLYTSKYDIQKFKVILKTRIKINKIKNKRTLFCMFSVKIFCVYSNPKAEFIDFIIHPTQYSHLLMGSDVLDRLSPGYVLFVKWKYKFKSSRWEMKNRNDR